jgi:hypothetical protein
MNNQYTGYIAPGETILAQWLAQTTVVGPPQGQIPVSTVRNDFSGVNAPATLWMSVKDPNPGNFPIHYTFDTPFVKGGADGTCGRVVYSDFHVENADNANGAMFPGECQNLNNFTAQEKLLEFMLLNLTSCVSPPTCTPLTCANYPTGTCGVQSDGCGGMTADCLQCKAPQTCGGGGTPGVCGGGNTCVAETCAQQGIQCGPAGDGCGNQIPGGCGTCPAPQTCGGGGVPGKCGGLIGCTPKTCAEQGISCGPAGDGCGNPLECGLADAGANGGCAAGQTCGGGGVQNKCGTAGKCTPSSCADQKIACGPAGDGCGNLLQCGSCVAPATCGGGGVFGQCGGINTAQ